MKYVKLLNNTVVEVLALPEGVSISTALHPDLHHLYIQGPEHVTVGSTISPEGVWSIAPAAPVADTTAPPRVSPPEFKLLFTSPERVAMRQLRTTDAIVDDFFDIIDDPRLTYVDMALQSTQDALSYLVSVAAITEERKAEILTGKVK